MPKNTKVLTALEVGRIKDPGTHLVGTVAGLALNVTPSGAGRSWLLRTMVAGKRREFGLGPYPEVTLAMAHQKARDFKEKIRQGIDPIAEKKEAARLLMAERFKGKTFNECATAYVLAHAPTWTNPKHRQQWENTLAQYCGPVVGELPVGQVDTAAVMAVLQPIWTTKTETATRLRGRIEQVLDWATVQKMREGENPARWKGHLDKLLPKPSKVAKVEHHAAMPYQDLPVFLPKLLEVEGMGARAVQFTILTAARSGEVRGAKWSEFDLKARLWTVPTERMKAKREHRVPLSDQAVALLESLPRLKGSDFVFWGMKGTELSDMTLTAVMRRMGLDYTVHGFRSSFRDWAAERTAFPREVAEAALAHTNADKVEAAYLRSDLFEKRRALLQLWATFVHTPTLSADVIQIGQHRAG